MENNLCSLFAANMKMKRRELGLTQKDLAEQINYSTTAISKWEAGHALPPTILLPTLAKILHTTVDYLLSTPPDIKYYLGIAGYDEVCDISLCDREGKKLKNLTIETVNPNVIGIDKMLSRVTDSIFRIAGDMKFQEISVAVGIDGIYRLGKNELSNKLRALGFAKVQVLSNSRNAIEVALGDSDGIFVNIGYGSIVQAKREDGKIIRVGGYGYHLDEPLSSFTLGKSAVSAVFLANDGLAPATKIEKFIRTEMKIFEGELSPVVFSDRFILSRLACTVFFAYREGDKVAKSILKENFEKIANMIIAAAEKGKVTHKRVVLFGENCKYDDIVIDLLSEELSKRNEKYEISVCDRSAVLGALRLAGLGVMVDVRK